MKNERREEVAAEAHRIAEALNELGSLDAKIAEAARQLAVEHGEQVEQLVGELETLLGECEADRGDPLVQQMQAALDHLRQVPGAEDVVERTEGNPAAEDMDSFIRETTNQLEAARSQAKGK